MHFVVGFDGSDFSRRALERAADLAGASGHVQVVAAIPDNSAPDGMVGQQRTLREAAGLLSARGVSHTTTEAMGRPAAAIAAAARDSGADIIVVGSRGRGAAAGLLLGSVSSELVRESPCDVLVVR
jgi:nucleotide-binding universal stress UspA family protein